MDGQVRWLYRTKRGLDCDILVCDDRYAEQPEFTHLTKLPSGCYTIPSSGPTPKCLTFTAGAGGASVGFIVSNGPCDIPEDYTMPSLQYSTDGGETWEDYDLKVAYSIDQEDAIPLAEGESVMFKGVNENLAYYLELEGESEGFAIHVQACVEGNVAASGDVTSLLNGVGGNVAMGQYCYFGMFLGCTGLTQAPTLPATTLAEGCYSYMFNECTCILSHDVMTLNLSYNMFGRNSSCTSLTVRAEEPPTIAKYTLTGLKADCVIYVPAAKVEAYKYAQYWSARRDYIQAIQ